MQKSKQLKLGNEYLVYLDRVLGKGSTGIVCEGIQIEKQEPVAVKIIDLATIDNEVTQYLLEMEKTALVSIQSPHVLKCHKIL